MRTDSRFAEKLLEQAISRGVSLAEVYQRAAKTLSVDVREKSVEAVKTSSEFGYCLRVINKGRLGFSYSSSKEEMDMVIETALKTADFTESDEFLDLPEPLAPEKPEVFDPEIEAVNEDRAIETAILIEQSSIDADRRIKKTRKASSSFIVKHTLVLNSKGLSYGYPTTLCSAHITAVAEEEGESQMGWGFQSGRFLSDVSFAQVGTDAAGRALKMLGARRIHPSKSPVLLDNSVAAEFLSLLAVMLSSESVQKGKSLLKGQLGRRVISELMDVTDNGLLEHGPGTRHIDDEGVPASRTELIKEGVLRGLMYNTHTARKDNVRSTGNAVRGGASSLPSVGPANLYISPAENPRSLPWMLESMDEGLYIIETMGMHTANPISGEFSVGVSGIWVENGELRYPVKEAVISGNLLEFFSNLQAVGDDLRFYGNIGSPSILTGPTDIST